MNSTTGEPRLNRLLTAAELAERWGEDTQTIYTLAREKGLPVIRFGRAMRFDPRAVAEWAANGGTAGNAGG